MLMTKPVDRGELPDLAQDILAALEAVGAGERWVLRSEIASAMDKKRLNGGDIATLDMLAIMDFVQVERREADVPIGWAIQYKLTK